MGFLDSDTARAANGSVAYTYDALGRLITTSYDTGVCIAYSYDPNGNRLSEKILVISSSSTGVWGCFNWNGAKWGP
ncbi:RHS repeat domain-containing protein [Reyranella sp.]|uniref:RHS repeat domain-containing protein n=1 Tax=Reyranella sp. TaxID=1929291 RepID=UPI00344865DC